MFNAGDILFTGVFKQSGDPYLQKKKRSDSILNLLENKKRWNWGLLFCISRVYKMTFQLPCGRKADFVMP